MFNEETLMMIEECGRRQFSEEETCIIVDIREGDYEKDETARRRYRKGVLLAQFEVRETVVKHAKEGIPQMVRLFQGYSDRNECESGICDDGGDIDQ